MNRLLPLLLALTWACGGDDDDGGSSTSGEVTEAFAQYCVATFTRDFDIVEFDEVTLRVKEGQRFLLGELDEFAGSPRAEIVFIGGSGVTDFRLELAEGEELPFTSNCAVDETDLYLGVFQDVTLYADAGLRNVLCKLTAGTVAKSSGWSQVIAGDLDFTGPNTYEISLGGLSSRCDDQEKAYLSDGRLRIGDTEFSVLPVAPFRAPKAVEEDSPPPEGSE